MLNYHTIALNLYASKVILKILQARLQQYVTNELSDVQVGFRKGRGTRDQIANISWIIEKEGKFQKNTLLVGMENSLAVLGKHKATIWPSNSTPRFILKRFKNVCAH